MIVQTRAMAHGPAHAHTTVSGAAAMPMLRKGSRRVPNNRQTKEPYINKFPRYD